MTNRADVLAAIDKLATDYLGGAEIRGVIVWAPSLIAAVGAKARTFTTVSDAIKFGHVATVEVVTDTGFVVLPKHLVMRMTATYNEHLHERHQEVARARPEPTHVIWLKDADGGWIPDWCAGTAADCLARVVADYALLGPERVQVVPLGTGPSDS